MTRVGLAWRDVVNRFTARVCGVSTDGQVHSDGCVLCVHCRPIARWEEDRICLTRLDCQDLPTDLSVFVQGYIKRHQTVQGRIQYGNSN